VVVVYEINSIMTPYTGTSGSCNIGSSCSRTIQTSPLATSANSFLATTAADCQSSSGSQRHVTAGPANFATDYGLSNAEYAGHYIPGTGGSQTFQMTSSSSSNHPVCWSVAGAQFLDPPIVSPASPSTTQSPLVVGRMAISHSASDSGDISGVSILSVCIMSMALEFPKKTKTTCHPREAQFKR